MSKPPPKIRQICRSTGLDLSNIINMSKYLVWCWNKIFIRWMMRFGLKKTYIMLAQEKGMNHRFGVWEWHKIWRISYWRVLTEGGNYMPSWMILVFLNGGGKGKKKISSHICEPKSKCAFLSIELVHSANSQWMSDKVPLQPLKQNDKTKKKNQNMCNRG